VGNWAEAEILEQTGLQHYRAKQLEEAICDLGKALKVKQKIVGSESATLSVLVNNFAGVWKASGRQKMQTGDYAAAETAFLQSAAVLQSTFGDHPAVAVARNEAVQACKSQGKLREAYALCQQNLATFRAHAVSDQELEHAADMPLVADSCDDDGGQGNEPGNSNSNSAERNVVQVLCARCVKHL
jgi:tetratricopeptide (TPR) repeat protein